MGRRLNVNSIIKIKSFKTFLHQKSSPLSKRRAGRGSNSL
jgi:hypothetical protein